MPVAGNDDTTRCGKGKASLVTFDAVAGTTYKIASDVKGGAGDAMVLNADVPSNDFFEHAAPLSGSGAVDADTGVASAEPGEPAHAGTKAVNSLWWTYTAPADGTVHLDTCASTEYDDTTLAVYTGAALDALTPVASDDDADGCPDHRSSVDFQATAGTTYRRQPHPPDVRRPGRPGAGARRRPASALRAGTDPRQRDVRARPHRSPRSRTLRGQGPVPARLLGDVRDARTRARRRRRRRGERCAQDAEAARARAGPQARSAAVTPQSACDGRRDRDRPADARDRQASADHPVPPLSVRPRGR
jgi:hypothetical protein